jgi:hypothetical protein
MAEVAVAADIRLEVLDGWAEIEQAVPGREQGRLPDYLAGLTGVQRRHIVAARHVRNRIAHEGAGSVPLDELQRAAITIRQIKTGLGLDESGEPLSAFGAPGVSEPVSASREGAHVQFAGHWREEMGPHDVLEWHLSVNGSFSARPVSLRNPLYRLTVSKWYGEWDVSLDDPAGPWIELVATDLESPALGFLGALTGQSKTPGETLDRLTRSANITSSAPREFTLSWTGYRGERRYTSIWKML